MSDLHTCSRCFLPIHRDDAVAYLGDRVAHQYSRCVALQRAEIERLRAEVESLRNADDSHDEMLHEMWRGQMLDLVREYRIADDGDEVRDAWRAVREHIGVLPASLDLTVPELRAGIALQLKEIDSLRNSLRAEGDRISELKDELAAERQRARMPDELVERARNLANDGEAGRLAFRFVLRDILAWHDRQNES